MTNNIITTILGLMCLTFMVVSFSRTPAYDPIKYYDRNGLVSPITRIYRDTFLVNSSSGYSVDISAAGFSSVKVWNVVALKNTAASTSVPNVGVKSVTTTALVLNFTEGNSSLVNVLGSNVLLGASNAFANTSGLWVAVEVKGN